MIESPEVLLQEVPKPLNRLRMRLVEAYKFCENRRVELQASKPGSFQMFEPTREQELAEREIEEADTKVWGEMTGYRQAIAMVDSELEQIVREHLVMTTERQSEAECDIVALRAK